MVNQFYYEIEYTIKIEEANQRRSRGLWPPLAPSGFVLRILKFKIKLKASFQ
jgi:hypothetical protein